MAYNDVQESLDAPSVEWLTIMEDQVYNSHIKPWLEGELKTATEAGLHDRDPGREYWLGFRDALKIMIEQPEREVSETARISALAKENERKANENARRVRLGSTILRRLRPDWWTPRTG